MISNPAQIKFQNRQNPHAGFDLIRLEDVFVREDLDHSPFMLHRVEFYLIILIEAGEGKHTIDFTDYSYTRGSLLTVRKDQIHKFFNNESVRGVMLLFTDDFLVSYLEQLEALRSLQLFNEIIGVPKIQLSSERLKEVSSLIQRIRKEYFKINDEYSLGIIRSELHILLALLYRLKSQRDQLVANRKYLSEFVDFQNLVERHVTAHKQVQDYAKMLACSSKTLNTITSTIINKSAKAFIDDICTKQIKRLLINTSLPIKEIAYASGFEAPTNFYKYFKRHTSFTPEQFRANF